MDRITKELKAEKKEAKDKHKERLARMNIIPDEKNRKLDEFGITEENYHMIK